MLDTSAISIDIDNLPRNHQSLYGSRRLGVHKTISDYDIYLHSSEINLFTIKKKNYLRSSIEYLNSSPKYGKVFLVTNLFATINGKAISKLADILIFSDRRDIAIMDTVLSTMETYSRHHVVFFQDKGMRIALFNYGLQQEGFIANLNKKLDYPTEVKILWPVIKNYYLSETF